MKLFQVADRYCKESSWKILALLKICLFSIGVMVGMLVPKEKKKVAFGIGNVAFLSTYFPLMGKFFRTWQQENRRTQYE